MTSPSTGIASLYSILQTSVWFTCHTATLFWAVKFPLHRKYHERVGHMKYIHTAVVLAGLLLPSIPVIVVLATGGFTTTYSPLTCTVKDVDAVFFSFIFPHNIVIIFTMTLLVLIFWTIIREAWRRQTSKQVRLEPVTLYPDAVWMLSISQ